MNTPAFNALGASYVVAMIAATDKARASRLLAACVAGAGFSPHLLTTWPLLKRHVSGATVGIWVLVAAAEKGVDVRGFIDGRREIDADVDLEVVHAWPSRPGLPMPTGALGQAFRTAEGLLVVFPSPLIPAPEASIKA